MESQKQKELAIDIDLSDNSDDEQNKKKDQQF